MQLIAYAQLATVVGKSSGWATPEFVTAVTGALALAFVAGQWRSAVGQNRQAEAALAAQLRQQWHDLETRWHIAIMLAIGPDDFYTPTTGDIRSRFRQLLEDLQAMEALASTRMDEYLALHSQTRERSHEFQVAARDVVLFLGALSSLMLEGRISVPLVYSIVGNDIAPRSRQVRVLVGASPADYDRVVGDVPAPVAWDYWVDASPGLRERVLVLVDLMWAEAAAYGDVEVHALVSTAAFKRSKGTGVKNRLRVRRWSLVAGGRWTALRLERLLLKSEFVAPACLYQAAITLEATQARLAPYDARRVSVAARRELSWLRTLTRRSAPTMRST